MRFVQRQFFNEGREENYFARLFGKARRFHRHGASLDTQAELIQEVSQRYWDHIVGTTAPRTQAETELRKRTFWNHHCKVRVCVVDGQDVGGFIVPYGELKALWCDVPGLGGELIRKAIELGARELNCFDGPLVGLYSQFGFEVTARVANLTAGGPDVVYMELP